MAVTRRVYVSMPADVWLSDKQNALKWGVVEVLGGQIYASLAGRSNIEPIEAAVRKFVSNV